MCMTISVSARQALAVSSLASGSRESLPTRRMLTAPSTVLAGRPEVMSANASVRLRSLSRFSAYPYSEMPAMMPMITTTTPTSSAMRPQRGRGRPRYGLPGRSPGPAGARGGPPGPDPGQSPPGPPGPRGGPPGPDPDQSSRRPPDETPARPDGRNEPRPPLGGTEALPDELPLEDVVADMDPGYVTTARRPRHPHRFGTKGGVACPRRSRQ